jgi:hypothetical protein
MGIAAVLEGWWSDRITAREYDALGPQARDALARDAGVSREALDRIVARGPRAGQELPRLLQSVGAAHGGDDGARRTRSWRSGAARPRLCGSGPALLMVRQLPTLHKLAGRGRSGRPGTVILPECPLSGRCADPGRPGLAWNPQEMASMR